jgi:hypothetical protein
MFSKLLEESKKHEPLYQEIIHRVDLAGDGGVKNVASQLGGLLGDFDRGTETLAALVSCY